ncbi:MAG: tape measure protein, partial [Sphingopyxis terrae]|nr:tape measure protein [Sphingopyxis terrae]
RSSGAIGNSLKGLAATFAGAFTGRELLGMIDGFTRLQNSLRVAGLEGEALGRVQGQLLELSARYGVNIEALANLYGKATDAGRSFGASEAQVLELTKATSQALLITGTGAAQAQGAILGLSQALASGTVRAEEYNQINEGGLRPLLQAAAATEKYGGDINKFRAAVLAGKVSSQEFFQAIMAGAAQLDAQASKATLTLAGAFEALSSQLTVYVGQSAQANGATAALAGAIKLLADNLDIIIPALALIAATLGTTMVLNAVASSRAFFALTAAIGGAATAAEAATFAFGGLGAVLTGPAGIAAAVVAVGAGLYYMSQQADGTEEAISRLDDSNRQARDELEQMIGRLKEAGVNTEALGKAAADAAGKVDQLADAYRNALIEARKFSQGTAGGKIQDQANIVSASQAEQRRLEQAIANNRRARGFASGDSSATANLDQQLNGLRAQLAGERSREAVARTTIQALSVANAAGVDLEASKSTPSTPSKPKKATRSRATKDPLDQQFRNDQQLLQLQLEELRAKGDVAQSASERADYSRQALAIERDMRLADIDEAVRKKSLTKEEADARKKIIEGLYGAAGAIVVQNRESEYQRQITREEEAALNRQKLDAMRDEVDALSAESGVTDVRKERVAIERRILDLQQKIETSLLEEAIARGDVLDAAQARAQLARKQAADRAGFDRANQGPLGQYLDEVRKVGLNLDDEFEKIAVGGLQSLNDGLTDAIVNSRNLGDVFRNVAKQIIADLIRIAIQQQIVNALSSAFSFGGSGGGGGGGLLSTIANVAGTALKFSGKTPGRASGGPVNAGSLYRINEGSSPGNPEYFQPAMSGTVIPLGQINQKVAMPGAGQQQPIQLRIYADEGGTFVPRVEAISAGVTIEVQRQVAPGMIDAAANEALRRAGRPKI